jgi:hypothetical protein
MHYALNLDELKKETLYNRIRQSDYCADDYLNDIEIVKENYKDLYLQYGKENIVYIIDPPYLTTDTKTYNSDRYWSLKDYLDVLSLLKESNYILFTSGKSHIIELCEWFGENGYNNPLLNATITKKSAKPTYNSTFEDIMIVQKK